MGTGGWCIAMPIRLRRHGQRSLCWGSNDGYAEVAFLICVRAWAAHRDPVFANWLILLFFRPLAPQHHGCGDPSTRKTRPREAFCRSGAILRYCGEASNAFATAKLGNSITMKRPVGASPSIGTTVAARTRYLPPNSSTMGETAAIYCRYASISVTLI